MLGQQENGILNIETIMDFEKRIAAIQKANLTDQEKESWANYFDIKSRIKDGIIFEDIIAVASFIQEHFSFAGNIFRGQVKNWPIKSSGWRIPESERDKRWEATLDFMRWILNNEYLEPFHTPQQKLCAIAQHYSYEYSLCTNLIDFTYDYKIACFFATDSKSIESEDVGVVIISNLPSMKVAYSYMGIDGIKQFDMKGMWRLENQKGMFLEDINGDFEIFGRFIKLLFKQNKDVRFETDSINSISIYPQPNNFEEEINRYLNVKLRSRPIEEIDPDNLFTIIKVEKDPISAEFEAQIEELNWESEKTIPWKYIQSDPYIEVEITDSIIDIVIDNYNCFEVTTSENARLSRLIEHIDKAGSTAFTPRINLRVNKADPLFHAEIASRLFTNMVSEFSKNYGNLPFETTHKLLTMKVLSLFAIYKSSRLITVIDDELDILCMAYQTGKLTLIEFEDYQGIVSKAYIDRDFCEELSQMTLMKKKFNEYFKDRKGFLDKNGELIEIRLDTNYQLFQFVDNAKALFSWEDVLNIWALYVIPYQVFFRNNHSSVFNPYYLYKCGLA
jgi:hypothetical protein